MAWNVVSNNLVKWEHFEILSLNKLHVIRIEFGNNNTSKMVLQKSRNYKLNSGIMLAWAWLKYLRAQLEHSSMPLNAVRSHPTRKFYGILWKIVFVSYFDIVLAWYPIYKIRHLITNTDHSFFFSFFSFTFISFSIHGVDEQWLRRTSAIDFMCDACNILIYSKRRTLHGWKWFGVSVVSRLYYLFLWWKFSIIFLWLPQIASCQQFYRYQRSFSSERRFSSVSVVFQCYLHFSSETLSPHTCTSAWMKNNFCAVLLLHLLYAEENENGNKKDLFLWHRAKPRTKWTDTSIVNVCGLCITIFIGNAVIK